MNIYERQTNVKQLSIDNLPYREYVKECKVYYNSPCNPRTCKSMHITLDYHDQAKTLKTMDLKTLPKRITKHYYIKYDNKIFSIDKFKKYCRIRKIRVKEDYRNNCFITSKHEIIKYYYTTRNKMIDK